MAGANRLLSARHHRSAGVAASNAKSRPESGVLPAAAASTGGHYRCRQQHWRFDSVFSSSVSKREDHRFRTASRDVRSSRKKCRRFGKRHGFQLRAWSRGWPDPASGSSD